MAGVKTWRTAQDYAVPPPLAHPPYSLGALWSLTAKIPTGHRLRAPGKPWYKVFYPRRSQRNASWVCKCSNAAGPQPRRLATAPAIRKVSWMALSSAVENVPDHNRQTLL